MTVVHTCFYIVVDTKRGCRTLKLLIFLVKRGEVAPRIEKNR